MFVQSGSYHQKVISFFVNRKKIKNVLISLVDFVEKYTPREVIRLDGVSVYELVTLRYSHQYLSFSLAKLRIHFIDTQN